MKYKFFLFIVSFVIFAPLFTFAQNNTPFITLVGIPGLDNITGDEGLNGYINALYRISISIAALLAVIKIVAAGAKYMLSDIVTNKEEAKKDIQGALIGLLIVISAIIILNTINTDLTKIDFNLEQTDLKDEVRTGPEAEKAKQCDGPDGCTVISCGNTGYSLPGVSEFLPAGSGSTCQEQCKAAEGFAYTETVGGRVECAIKNSTLVEIITDSKCPAGTNCTVVQCDNNGIGYGVDYTKLFNNTCAAACSDLGIEYISRGQLCVIADSNNNQTLNCDATDKVYGQPPNEIIIDKCTDVREQCYDESGYVISTTSTSIVCTIPIKTEPVSAKESCIADGRNWLDTYNTCEDKAISFSAILPNTTYTDIAGTAVKIQIYGNFGGLTIEGLPNIVEATYPNGAVVYMGCHKIKPNICAK